MYICPVCGYDNLLESPYDQFGYPSYEICSCCGYEFGFTDSSEKKDFEEYRTEWVNSGFNFFLKSDQPVKWDREELLKQLKNIEKVNYQARL
ncbi:hypothetical protein J2T02_004331 [Chitinophaga terrae (ex Kim and Jung 2007)]|nr:hypothetical protein [Chitinophaga terrae (ex Kim and Jung 2007)]